MNERPVDTPPVKDGRTEESLSAPLAAHSITGADVIALFIRDVLGGPVFTVTGGACAFILDAVASHSDPRHLVVMQHEQSAAMAADATWRAARVIGTSVVTSGPGATNLITGICCSWFDSIPALHITGQVPQNEQSSHHGLDVRQLGFQETDVVAMVRSVTKFAKRVSSITDLVESLFGAVREATSGRPGPVLVDVPMNLQQAVLSKEEIVLFNRYMEESRSQNWESCGSLSSVSVDVEPESQQHSREVRGVWDEIWKALRRGERPLAIVGNGAVSGGLADALIDCFGLAGIPYVATWGGAPTIRKIEGLYLGTIGVYGERIANFALQNADVVCSFGARLENRQRTANIYAFAPFARLIVVDGDPEEIKKVARGRLAISTFDPVEMVMSGEHLHHVQEAFASGACSNKYDAWLGVLRAGAEILSAHDIATRATEELSPYESARAVLAFGSARGFVVVADTGANLCWAYQSLAMNRLDMFTAGGHSPMGYALPAAVGVATLGKPAIALIGDGGLQMCLHELQTVRFLNLPIIIFLFNNDGYGLIKQFQDSNLDSRYVATGSGYSQPNWRAVSMAYDIPYMSAETSREFASVMTTIESDSETVIGPLFVELKIPADAPTVPKVDGDSFLHDQWPKMATESLPFQFAYPERPSELQREGTSHPQRD